MKKGTKTFAALLIGATFALGLGACQPKQPVDPTPTPTPVQTYAVTIANKAALQAEWPANGGGRKVEINVEPKANVAQLVKDGNIVITSSNTAVLNIAGLMAMPVAAGQATITVTSGENSDTVEVEISEALTIKTKYGVAHEGTEDDPLTNEEAIAIANHADYKADGGHEDLYVRGIVSSFYHAPGSRTDGAVSWFLTPATGQTAKFEIYKCYKQGTGEASYLTDSDVWVGADVLAHGRFTLYNGQAETDGATYVRAWGTPPAPRTTIEETFANALAAGKALEDGADSYDYYKFDAYVTKKSGTNYFLTAAKAEAITDEKANTIEIYNAAAALDAKLTKNAKVTVKMILKNYHGQVENLLALTADDITVVEAGVPWVIPEHNVTVAEGLTVVNGLADGATTADLYNFTEVYVKEVTDAYNAEYGNMSFKIADTADGTNTITVFRAKTDATTAAKVVAGAQVTVKGNLQKYVKDGATTPELLNVASITVKENGGGGTTTMVPAIVDTPVAGVKYKFGMKISAAADKTADVFSTGVKSGNYGATTETFADAADFELVAVTGGYNVKVTLPDNSVKYLNGVVSGDYTNISFDDAASTVFTYDTAAKTLFFTANGHTTATKDGVYYFGTYTSKGSTYTTISCSMSSYIQGDNASKIDASQFPAHFWELVEDTSGGEGGEGGEGGGGEQTSYTSIGALSYNKNASVVITNELEDATDPKITYVENGVTIVVRKGSSSSDVNVWKSDYASCRWYVGHAVTISSTQAFKRVVLTCDSSYDTFKNGATGVIANVSGGATVSYGTGTVILELETAATTITINPDKQLRPSNVELFKVAA